MCFDVASDPKRDARKTEAELTLQLPGTITGRCEPPPGFIRIYEAQGTLDPSGDTWSEVQTFLNSRSFKFSGLTRGKDMWVRVRARNSHRAPARGAIPPPSW